MLEVPQKKRAMQIFLLNGGAVRTDTKFSHIVQSHQLGLFFFNTARGMLVGFKS